MSYPPYIPPDQNGIPFDFTTASGYVSPQATDLSIFFTGRTTYQATAYLQNVVNVMQNYQASTYTYLKECPTIIVGYSNNGIQRLSLPCVYAGIRDIGAQVYGNLRYRDLGAYIAVDPAEFELPSYLKAVFPLDKDLGSLMKIFQKEIELNLTIAIRPWYRGNILDFPAYVKQTFDGTPLDISSYAKVNFREYLDKRSLIKGWYYGKEINFPGTIQSWYVNNTSNISAYVKQTFDDAPLDMPSYAKAKSPTFLNLIHILHGWQEANFSANIISFSPVDLGGIIRSVYEVNLTVFLRAIRAVNLGASIDPISMYDLAGSITGGYGPYDLESIINIISPKNLTSYIAGYGGIEIERNLNKIIYGWEKKDLQSLLTVHVLPTKDLESYLNAIGQALDLPSLIFPKTIRVKRFIPITLLEHKDLIATINYACFGTGYKLLGAYITPKQKRDLRGFIFGWTGDNIINLNAKINTATYRVEDKTQINITDSLNAASGSVSYNVINMSHTFDTVLVKYGNYGSSNISSYISGIKFSSMKDLITYITADIDVSYDSTPWRDNKTVNEVVINLNYGETRVEKQIEMQFKEAVQDYFYVSGDSKVYKMDRNSKWVIRITGFEYNSDTEVERTKIRDKYLFNLLKYNSIDAAIRDLMDRVSFYRRFDLTSKITSSGGYNNLTGHIFARRTYKSNRKLFSRITPIP